MNCERLTASRVFSYTPMYIVTVQLQLRFRRSAANVLHAARLEAFE